MKRDPKEDKVHVLYRKVQRPNKAVTSHDCLKCGACCVPEERDAGCFTYVPVDSQREINRLPSRFVIRHTPTSALPTTTLDRDVAGEMLTRETRRGTRCIALGGQVGVAVSCKVYNDRPNICRSFKPGSIECLGAREQAGLKTGGERCT